MNEKTMKLDTYTETQKKIHKWKEKSSMKGYYSAWELRKILSTSKYLSHIKTLLWKKDANSEVYANQEEYWLYILPQYPEEYVCNLMLSTWYNDIKTITELLSRGRTNIILNGNLRILENKEGEYTEDLVVDKKHLQIIFSSPSVENPKKDTI